MTTEKEFDELGYTKGRPATWRFVFRGERVKVYVTILDTRKLWNRLDVLIVTNAGSEIWASTDTVEPHAVTIPVARTSAET